MTRLRRSSWLFVAAGARRAASCLAGSCLVAVDETEYAVVTNFGRVVAVHGLEAGHRRAAFQAAVAGRACGSIAGSGLSTRRRAR